MAYKLLIVDDEADTLRLVSLMLERQGYEIITAKDGKTALSKVTNDQPDLIVLDVMMPDMDGFEVLNTLRKNPKTENIPIIMFTARSQVEDKIIGLEAGADVYLTKPTQPREFFAQVKAVLNRYEKSRKLPQSSRERGLTVGVLSAKGGIGVSSVAVNLGVVIHQQTKENVIVAELRPGYGGISISLGYPNPEGLNRLLKVDPGEITPSLIENALTNHDSGIQLLLASPQPKEAIMSNAANNFEAIIKILPTISPYVVLDLGSSLPPVTQRALIECDEIVIILEPTLNNVLQSKRLIDDLFDLGFNEDQIRITLVNRIRSSAQLNRSQVEEELGYPTSTIFTPAPELAYQAEEANEPMVLQQPGSITAQQFDKLAAIFTRS